MLGGAPTAEGTPGLWRLDARRVHRLEAQVAARALISAVFRRDRDTDKSQESIYSCVFKKHAFLIHSAANAVLQPLA